MYQVQQNGDFDLRVVQPTTENLGECMNCGGVIQFILSRWIHASHGRSIGCTEAQPRSDCFN